ncbi:MAG: class I SAM-dependent methyltransferase [Endozoicomonas sp.]
MPGQSLSFSGNDMPDYYDSFIFPINVKSLAMEVADRVLALKPGKLLEIAAGTGAASECLISRLNSATDYTLTDISNDMLEKARQRFKCSPHVECAVVDATSIPYASATFDTLVCQLGLMFFSDRALALKEFRRVLQPGGKLVFSVWDSLEYHALINRILQLLEEKYELTGSQHLGMPHCFFQLDTMKSMLEMAGFQRLSFEVVSLTCPDASITDTLRGTLKGIPLGEQLLASGVEDLEGVIEAIKPSIEREFGDPLTGIQRQAIIVSAA